jgi:hypothetical protein
MFCTIYFLDIFDLQLVESTDVETTDTEGHLYSLSYYYVLQTLLEPGDIAVNIAY